MTIPIPYSRSGTGKGRREQGSEKYIPIHVGPVILAFLLVYLLKLSHCGKDLSIRGVELLAVFLRGCI